MKAEIRKGRIFDYLLSEDMGWCYPNSIHQQKRAIIDSKPGVVRLMLLGCFFTAGPVSCVRVESKINAAKCCQILQPEREL